MSTNRYAKSAEFHARASRVLAGGVASEFRKFGQPHPLAFARASGSHITDLDGNEYLDFTLSQGPLILGHSHPHVLESVRRYSAEGQLFAGQHLLEIELAEKLQAHIPCAELMRFSLSGSEADHTALRLSRAVTQRDKFIRFEGQYHGWLDNVAAGLTIRSIQEGGKAPQPAVPWTQGLPARIDDESIVLGWNDLSLVEEVLAKRGQEVAALITEPIMCNNGCIPPEPGFLEGLRALCDRYGVVLIFDEVITGFRLGLGGAQKLFKITPDLGVFGKAMASGYPISVLAGKKKLMDWIADGRVVHAGTMNSGHAPVAAAMATLQVLEREKVPAQIAQLGLQLMEGLRDAARRSNQPLLVQGPGPMFHTGFTSLERVRNFRETLSYDKPRYARFVLGMQERGIRLIGRGLWYLSGAHVESEIEACVSTAYEVLRKV